MSNKLTIESIYEYLKKSSNNLIHKLYLDYSTLNLYEEDDFKLIEIYNFTNKETAVTFQILHDESNNIVDFKALYDYKIVNLYNAFAAANDFNRNNYFEKMLVELDTNNSYFICIDVASYCETIEDVEEQILSFFTFAFSDSTVSDVINALQ